MMNHSKMNQFKPTIRPITEEDKIVPGTELLYGYQHCTNARTCFMKYRKTKIIKCLEGFRFRVHTEGNKNVQTKGGWVLYTKII